MTPHRTLALALALLLTATACVAPSQNDPTRWGTVTVATAPSTDGILDWRADQLAQIDTALRAMSAVGPTFTRVADALTADLVLREFDSGPGCAGGVERYTTGRFIDVDPACAHGYDELRGAVNHGIGHARGMGHVCLVAGDAADCHGLTGPAVMNPRISYGDVLEPGRFTGVGTDVPTQLDLDEWNRVHP